MLPAVSLFDRRRHLVTTATQQKWSLVSIHQSHGRRLPMWRARQPVPLQLSCNHGTRWDKDLQNRISKVCWPTTSSRYLAKGSLSDNLRVGGRALVPLRRRTRMSLIMRILIARAWQDLRVGWVMPGLGHMEGRGALVHNQCRGGRALRRDTLYRLLRHHHRFREQRVRMT